MIKLFILILAIIPSFLFSQKTKKIDDKLSGESYFVLKSDNSIKHGEYKKYGYNKALIVKGFFKNGNRDSLWECYSFNGVITLKYNYSNNELVFYNPNEKVKERNYRVINGVDIPDTILSRVPIYLYGEDFILSHIVKNTHYPSDAVSNGISGKIFVSFTIDKNGKTKNFHVKKPLGYGLEEEAIRVIKSIPENWLPGLANGQAVDVELDLPINFKLN